MNLQVQMVKDLLIYDFYLFMIFQLHDGVKMIEIQRNFTSNFEL